MSDSCKGKICAYRNNGEKSANMENIKIGKIVNAVALRGEVKVYHYSDRKERFAELSRILIKQKSGMIPYTIEKVRYQKDMVILKLKGVDDRNGAEALKELDVFITDDDLVDLPDDTFYVRDLIGCIAINIDDGKAIGKVSDVLQNTAQDIYQITTDEGKQVLIPAVGDFIKEVDVKEGKILIRLIPGFLD